MKNYHAVGIAICAAVIITCALSLTDTVHAAEHRPAICPTANESNSGYVATDEDHDGKPDTVWHIYPEGDSILWKINVKDIDVFIALLTALKEHNT